MHENASHTVYLAHGNSKGEAKRKEDKSRIVKVVTNLEREHEGEKSQTRPYYRRGPNFKVPRVSRVPLP